MVLLLHGLGATGDSWVLQIPALLDAGFCVLTPDLRGFGKSNFPSNKNDISTMAADILGLLDFKSISAAHVVGISMGGIVALQLALDYPDRVDRLILANTFAALRPSQLRVWFYYLIRIILVHTLGLETQARAVAKRVFPDADQENYRQLLVDQVCQANPNGYRACMRSLARFNVRSRLKEIVRPTLIITGGNDTTVPVAVQSQLLQNIRNASQIIIPEGGHAVSVDHPEEFNLALINFLTKT